MTGDAMIIDLHTIRRILLDTPTAFTYNCTYENYSGYKYIHCGCPE